MDKAAKLLVKRGDAFLQKNSPRKFHLEAARLLGEFDFPEMYSFKKLVEISFKQNIEKIQNYRSFEFSDLPLTLARGESCFLDLYVWRRRPTTIHNHHFMGAFQCLEGSNVDLKFSWETKKKIGKLHSTGKLTLDETRSVQKGSIVPIDLQDRFIHQNHHHSDITVNLCFRTPDFPKKNIANFLYSGFRYEKERTTLMKAERLFRMARVGAIETEKLSLSVDDMICFLIQSYGTTSENPNFLKMREAFSKKVFKEHRLNTDDILDQHESELDLIQSNYN